MKLGFLIVLVFASVMISACVSAPQRVLRAHVINDDDGGAIAGKEVALYTWKIFLGFVAKRYLVASKITDAEGYASFEVKPGRDFDFRLSRCPAGRWGLVHPLPSSRVLASDAKQVDVEIHYSVSHCIQVFEQLNTE